MHKQEKVTVGFPVHVHNFIAIVDECELDVRHDISFAIRNHEKGRQELKIIEAKHPIRVLHD
jgi:hypothetical protein